MTLEHKDGRRLRKPYGKHRLSLVPLPDSPELAPDHSGPERALRTTGLSRKVTRQHRSGWSHDLSALTRFVMGGAGQQGADAFVALRNSATLFPAPGRRVPSFDSRRAVDIVIALAALVATLPVLLIACVMMMLTMHRNVFFFQKRYGQYGRRFTLIKLRSLKDVADREAGECNAHRLTPVARVIRRFGVDEVPQFVNVLKGDMSLFGPRPFDIEPDVDGWTDRYAIKPGLIGLASVREKIAGVQSSLDKVVADDVEYISRRTWRLDAWLFVMAIACIFTGRIDPQEQRVPDGGVYRTLNRLAMAMIG